MLLYSGASCSLKAKVFCRAKALPLGFGYRKPRSERMRKAGSKSRSLRLEHLDSRNMLSAVPIGFCPPTPHKPAEECKPVECKPVHVPPGHMVDHHDKDCDRDKDCGPKDCQKECKPVHCRAADKFFAGI